MDFWKSEGKSGPFREIIDMGDLITIVVPVYKVEQYLGKCVDSIRKQTYPHLEIILVDDGSPDNCGSMCDEYAACDDRIVVIHKENGGLSDARNAALDIARGNYITFIDSDDYIQVDYIEYLYVLLKKSNADMSICEFDYITEDGKRLNHPLENGTEMLLDQKEALRYLLKQKPYSNSASGKLFKTSHFQDIRFPKDRLYEDTATTYKLFLKAEKIIFGARPLYYYVARNGSISRSAFSVRQMEGLYHAETMVKDIVAIYPDLQEQGYCRLIDSGSSLLTMIPKDQYPEAYRTAMNSVRRVRKRVLLSGEASAKRRVIAALSFLNEKLFISLLRKI